MEELEKSKYHQLDGSKKWVYAGIVLVFLIIGPVLFCKYYKFAVNRPAQGHREASFKIESGQGISEIASNLYREQLINSEFLFKLYLVIEGLQSNIQAGVYKIPAGSSMVKLADMFQYGMNDVKITFLEGWRLEEFAREADGKIDNVNYAEFIAKASKYEGRLFPDTYMFRTDASVEDIISTLKETYNKKTEDILTDDALGKVGLTEGEAVIFASIVEREVYSEEDRPIVAGILIDRWRKGLRLDADATVQYAVAYAHLCAGTDLEGAECNPPKERLMGFDWWMKKLSTADLDYPSPYNTRLNFGLPPKPICNPGLSSIEAVINYIDTDYEYYLMDAEGITHYARTLEEHNLNIQRFLN